MEESPFFVPDDTISNIVELYYNIYFLFYPLVFTKKSKPTQSTSEFTF